MYDDDVEQQVLRIKTKWEAAYQDFQARKGDLRPTDTLAAVSTYREARKEVEALYALGANSQVLTDLRTALVDVGPTLLREGFGLTDAEIAEILESPDKD